MDKKLQLDPPKRKVGQCMSCFYFYETKEAKCIHDNENDVETSDFCYDWMDIEDDSIVDY